MDISIHLGAHDTDDDQILKTLLRNKGVLAEEGIVVPGPGRYRPIMRETLKALRGAVATPEIEEVVLDSAMDVDRAERLVLSSENFICVPQRVLTEGVLYPNAAEKTMWLRNVFPRHDVEFFLALRDPATFIPANLRRHRDMDAADFLAHFDPMAQRWSDVVERIRSTNPGTPITVWCNEDSPLLWPEILRAVADHDPFLKLTGVDDILDGLMTEEGATRMAAFMEAKPPANEAQRRRIVAAFVEKFGIDDALEEELDMPGWTEEYVDALTAQYEEDIYQIQRIPGVTVLMP
ncbi:hypothetical protein BV394_03105 [Brevirhabdus pacifica]|uniref:Uncharacterized protein n=1 Tax=Brevirhabdus pacifica TaxID=1267768 RepID=A0A1U7DFU4_9RHOB|nr:hypothetical protein [Brevirhabdus pacifica]APX88842.1 hypothetical protein BV394_03105 [Brevirhabdus pacifica]OWU80081.1 hypothetical protein ATO5_03790 [Loktanella sp. 22II-4b]PJJ86621.1 hypothetical protein CLV77_1173 [Brevirhabdus pacifica]